MVPAHISAVLDRVQAISVPGQALDSAEEQTAL